MYDVYQHAGPSSCLQGKLRGSVGARDEKKLPQVEEAFRRAQEGLRGGAGTGWMLCSSRFWFWAAPHTSSFPPRGSSQLAQRWESPGCHPGTAELPGQLQSQQGDTFHLSSIPAHQHAPAGPGKRLSLCSCPWQGGGVRGALRFPALPVILGSRTGHWRNWPPTTLPLGTAPQLWPGPALHSPLTPFPPPTPFPPLPGGLTQPHQLPPSLSPEPMPQGVAEQHPQPCPPPCWAHLHLLQQLHGPKITRVRPKLSAPTLVGVTSPTAADPTPQGMGRKHQHRHARGRVYYTTQAKNPGQDPTWVRIEPALYQKVNTIVNPNLLWSLQSKRNIKRTVFIHRGKLKKSLSSPFPPPHSQHIPGARSCVSQEQQSIKSSRDVGLLGFYYYCHQ